MLVADDDPTILQALIELLADEPSVRLAGVARDAEQAVELAGRERPDVALIDVRMPGGGGPRATRGIKRRSPSTQVIALSAYGDLGTVAEMLQAGATSYLVKGANKEEIVHTIHLAARGSGTVATDLVRRLVEQPRDGRGRSHHSRRGAARVRQVLDADGPAMVFQPIVDLRDGRVVGLEALARFAIAPERPPDAWFAEAEAVGLGHELEAAALRAALVHLHRIPGDVFLSVNVSPRMAASRLLYSLATPRERIVIEITEHAPVDDYEGLGAALDRLREKGVRVAIDDAGAGFASLRHILRLAPDLIKLDITLTRDIDRDETRRALASALISFASAIGAAIVAEGIETQAELDALRDLGVPYGQGFYLARPAPLPEDAPPAAYIDLR